LIHNAVASLWLVTLIFRHPAVFQFPVLLAEYKPEAYKYHHQPEAGNCAILSYIKA
jgi:hypothetical protein